jgi:uncharacterized protein (DUF1499 family)
MDAGSTPPPSRFAAAGRGWNRVASFALALAALCGAADGIAALAYRAGTLALGPALQTIRWSAGVALAAFALALVAIVGASRSGRRRGVAIAATGLLVAAAVAGPPLHLWQRVQTLPRIHDVSTDTEQPPAFVAVLPLRAGSRNSTVYSADVAAQQKAGYPDLHPAALDVAPAEALRRAEQAARGMGWQIVAVDPAALRIEATATTLLFGFKDDVVIRVTPAGAGSRVDVRSLSRVGGSDLGANANRVRAFVDRLERK